jgi:hypothetical protein
MANGSTSSRHRMKKLTDKVLKTDIPMNQKVKSKPAADILGDTHYKGVPFSTDASLYSEQQQRGRARMSPEERHEFSKRERVSKGKKHQQHPLFTAQGVMDFDKQGQIDRYKSSDHSSKTPNNPKDTQKYHSSDKGLLQKAPEYTAKPVSKKVEKFHKRETKKEGRIIKKANKK